MEILKNWWGRIYINYFFFLLFKISNWMWEGVGPPRTRSSLDKALFIPPLPLIFSLKTEMDFKKKKKKKTSTRQTHSNGQNWNKKQRGAQQTEKQCWSPHRQFTPPPAPPLLRPPSGLGFHLEKHESLGISGSASGGNPTAGRRGWTRGWRRSSPTSTRRNGTGGGLTALVPWVNFPPF